MSAASVLVVDDEVPILDLVRQYLSAEGMDVALAQDGPSALDAVRDRHPDVIVLDVNLPGFDGFEVLRRIRTFSDAYVIMLTARAEEVDRIVGLSVGADDYLVKPFSPGELAARITSVLRRTRNSAPAAQHMIEFEGLRIDVTTREVEVDGALVDLTAKEFDLLTYLARSPRQVFSRDQLLGQVWESSSDWQDSATVTEHIRRIRRKIEQDPDNPRWIRTVRGVGYRFEP